MDWIRFAFGLLRDAVATGTEGDVNPNARPAPGSSPTQPGAVDIEALLAKHFAHVDRNLEGLVQMLNAQNEKLAETIRRQRIWNMALAAGFAVALLVAIFT